VAEEAFCLKSDPACKRIEEKISEQWMQTREKTAATNYNC